jgi:hypothetical protein
MNVALRQGLAVMKEHVTIKEILEMRCDPFLLLQLAFDVGNEIRRLHIQSDDLVLESRNRDLHVRLNHDDGVSILNILALQSQMIIKKVVPHLKLEVWSEESFLLLKHSLDIEGRGSERQLEHDGLLIVHHDEDSEDTGSIFWIGHASSLHQCKRSAADGGCFHRLRLTSEGEHHRINGADPFCAA